MVLIGYFAVQGFRYYQAQFKESALAEEISVLDRRIDAISSVGNMAEKIDVLKQKLEAKELLLEDRNLQLEELSVLFNYSSTDDLLKIVAATARQTGLKLVSISAGAVKAETVGTMTYQAQSVELSLGGQPADFFKFLAQLQQVVPVAAVTDVRLTDLEEDPAAQASILFFLSPVPVPTPTSKPVPTAVP